MSNRKKNKGKNYKGRTGGQEQSRTVQEDDIPPIPPGMFEEADLGTADTADTPQSDEDMEALMVAIENDNNNGIAVQAMPDAETLLMLEEDVGSDVDTEADTEVDTEAVSEDIGPQEDTERTEGATPETVTLEPHESPMPSAAVPCADGPAPIEAPPAEEEHHPIEAVPVLDDVPPEAVMADKDGLIGGDVLDDQTALFEADQEAETDQQHVPEDQPEVDKEEEEPVDDQPEVESDEIKKKRSKLFCIPLIGPVLERIGNTINKVREYKRTFYDEKYWKKLKGWHGNYVRSKLMGKGWVFLHRIWWDNRLSSYRDDVIFVKRNDLTKQNPKYLSKWGERQIPCTEEGHWLIFNSHLTQPEYEGENGFTASSGYLYMLDTSGEKAVRETTTELKSGRSMDKKFLILIAVGFIIVFGYFMLGGFGR